MARVEIRPFAGEHVDEAASLLRERQSRHHEAEPLLPVEVDLRAEVEELWRKGSSGAIAHRGRQAVGFLLGNHRDDAVRGPSIWVEFGGQAVGEAETIRDLYAYAAQRWVDERRRRHHALVPANDSGLIDAWFRLGFGQQQAHGIREVPSQMETQVPAGLEIRPPRREEIDDLMRVDITLPTHQRRAPVFSDWPLPTPEEHRKEWEDTLARDEEEVLIGYRDGKPIACWSFLPVELSGHQTRVGWPQRTCYLGFAATVPEARGSGIGTALTEAGLAWAAEEGYEAMGTDWRVTNLLASRFWPRRGFRTSFLRLYRSIP